MGPLVTSTTENEIYYQPFTLSDNNTREIYKFGDTKVPTGNGKLQFPRDLLRNNRVMCCFSYSKSLTSKENELISKCTIRPF